MAKVIAVGNFKGGVGKTTVTVNLALALREEGARVLLVDLDSQGQASLYLTDDESLAGKAGGSEQLLSAPEHLAVIETPSGIDVLHGHRGLGRIDEAGHSIEEAKNLRPYLAGLEYDYVVVDTPPDLAFRTLASLMWADQFVVVTTPDPLAQNSTVQFIKVVSGWMSKRWVKPGFKFSILMNMVDRASPEAVAEAEKARQMAPQFVLPTEFTLRRALVKRAFEQKIPVWKVKKIPKDVASAWRSLPQLLGLAQGEKV